ncbi:hypothetical protein RISK_000049 [Rhodopirellula islandica]|uniref:Uncharacterized protein n=1 Tax=Rhodopirellula islandica TaxID=595434 RepID=A0A0J1BMZ7_RHOIS|nr:hypothetical protein RISK_000049 [Rhodopirellula islandica]
MSSRWDWPIHFGDVVTHSLALADGDNVSSCWDFVWKSGQAFRMKSAA